MIWSEMAVQLRATGHRTDVIHRIVEVLRNPISAGSLYRRQPRHGGEANSPPFCR
jgi:hypothetical protein